MQKQFCACTKDCESHTDMDHYNNVHKYAMTAKVCKEMVILWYYN